MLAVFIIFIMIFLGGTASENDLVEISSIDVSPDPPKPGQNLTVNVKGTVKEIIEVTIVKSMTRLQSINI